MFFVPIEIINQQADNYICPFWKISTNSTETFKKYLPIF